MIEISQDRKLAVKTPYTGTVVILPFRSVGRKRIEVAFNFRGFVKRADQKFAMRYLKAEGFVEKATRE